MPLENGQFIDQQLATWKREQDLWERDQRFKHRLALVTLAPGLVALGYLAWLLGTLPSHGRVLGLIALMVMVAVQWGQPFLVVAYRERLRRKHESSSISPPPESVER